MHLAAMHACIRLGALAMFRNLKSRAPPLASRSIVYLALWRRNVSQNFMQFSPPTADKHSSHSSPTVVPACNASTVASHCPPALFTGRKIPRVQAGCPLESARNCEIGGRFPNVKTGLRLCRSAHRSSATADRRGSLQQRPSHLSWSIRSWWLLAKSGPSGSPRHSTAFDAARRRPHHRAQNKSKAIETRIAFHNPVDCIMQPGRLHYIASANFAVEMKGHTRLRSLFRDNRSVRKPPAAQA